MDSTRSAAARQPSPRRPALLNGKVYAFGGFTGPAHSAPVDYAYEYDPKTDAWRTLPALSASRGSPSAVALDGKLHVVGGRSAQNGPTLATHDVFDPTSGKWSTAAPLPTARD